jgi:phosphoglycerate kinase
MPVRKMSEISGPGVEAAVDSMKAGEILLLENSRFDPREKRNDPTLVADLGRLGDLYVNDAFSAAHRAHATTAGLAGVLPSVAGLQMEKELAALDSLLEAPRRPFVVVLGGAKVSDKIKVIDRFLDLANRILIGGAMSYAFLKAKGLAVGASKVEEEGVPVAATAWKKAEDVGCELVLPVDVLVADAMTENAGTRVVDVGAIPEGWMGVDIGPRTAAAYAVAISEAGQVFWNGPMGVFEIPEFAAGTRTIAQAMASSPALTMVGGGDSAAAVNVFGVADRIDHVSMGGGASLEFLGGATLPGLAVLPDRDEGPDPA